MKTKKELLKRSWKALKKELKRKNKKAWERLVRLGIIDEKGNPL